MFSVRISDDWANKVSGNLSQPSWSKSRLVRISDTHCTSNCIIHFLYLLCLLFSEVHSTNTNSQDIEKENTPSHTNKSILNLKLFLLAMPELQIRTIGISLDKYYEFTALHHCKYNYVIKASLSLFHLQFCDKQL